MKFAHAVSVGLFQCREGRLTWANDALVDLLGGRSGEALVGRSPDALFEDAGAGLPDWLGSEIARSTARPLDCWLRGEGGRRPVRLLGLGRGAFEVLDLHPLRAAQEEIHRLGRELRAVREELSTLRQRLDQELRERDELLTVVSHEIQTPLTVIAGFSRLLLGGEPGPLTAEQHKYLRETNRSCERLTRFARHLVDAHAAASAPAADPGPADLGATVRSVADWLRPLAHERGQHLEIALDPDARRARFDPARVEQVLTNLLTNALKHGRPGGRIEVHSRRRSAAGQAFVEVTVQDDGPGVAPDERERIFEPWTRGRAARDGEGLGLGLAICRRIVEAHGGTIDVTEADGGGAAFTFTLPAAPGTAEGRP